MRAPIVARWDGEAFWPIGRCAKECDAERVVGQTYKLVDQEDRSAASHAHYFAAIAECWANLPEHYAERFQNPEALRKFALIKTGFATQRQYVSGSRAEAERFLKFYQGAEEYQLATISGNVVTVWRAESQSYRSMGKRRFHESKDAVLSFISSLIGVAPEQLQQEAGKAA